MDCIQNNVERVRERILKAAQRSGRRVEDISLVAVTKTQPIERILEVVQAGVCDIGENRVQEILEKWDEIRHFVSLHFIGQLQTNKVKYIIDKANTIHSLDRPSLARELQLRANHANMRIPVLVQVNLTQDPGRGGVPECELPAFVNDISAMPNLAIRGLMAVAPLSAEDEVRRAYSRMRHHFETLGSKVGDTWNILSMGMSNDYEIAIEEGATLVRVGSAIFGHRE